MGTGGKVSFRSNLAGSGVGATNNQALFLGSELANIQMLARKSDPAPGLSPGVVFAEVGGLAIMTASGFDNVLIDQHAIFGDNRVAFVGRVTGAGIVTNQNDTGVWYTDANGSVQLLARAGDALATTTNSYTMTTSFLLQGGSGRDGRPAAGNRNNQFVFANGTNTFRVTLADGVTPFNLGKPAISGGNLVYTMPTQVGVNYTIQFSTNLSTPNWVNLTNFTGTGGLRTNAIPWTTSSGFRRVVAQP
jgi:hypothetical protein